MCKSYEISFDVNEIYKIIISNAIWYCDYNTHEGQPGQIHSINLQRKPLFK